MHLSSTGVGAMPRSSRPGRSGVGTFERYIWGVGEMLEKVHRGGGGRGVEITRVRMSRVRCGMNGDCSRPNAVNLISQVDGKV